MLDYHFFSLNKVFKIFENIFDKLLYKRKVLTPVVDVIASFIESRHSRLTNTFSIQNKDFSYNVDPIFYCKKKLHTILLEENDLEKQWKTRILMDNTPRGNVIMFYDVYKLGFAYYSDNSSMPYSVLNAVAMKYVLIFGCRDFFMDEKFVPADHLSPLIKVFLEDDKKTNDDDIKKAVANDIETHKKVDIKSGPFAKLKNYRLEEKTPQIYYNSSHIGNHSFIMLGYIACYNLCRWSIIGIRRIYYHLFIQKSTVPIIKNKVDIDTKTDRKFIKEQYTNKFINLGKTYNFSILQKKMVDLNFTDNTKSKYADLFSQTISRDYNTPNPVIKPLVQSTSAVSKNPKFSMTWHDYKSKLDEGSHVII